MTTIGASLTIKGEITSNEDVTVHGTLHGKISVTNGGLLVAASDAEALKEIFSNHDLTDYFTPIGKCIAKKEKVIYVQP